MIIKEQIYAWDFAALHDMITAYGLTFSYSATYPTYDIEFYTFSGTNVPITMTLRGIVLSAGKLYYYLSDSTQYEVYNFADRTFSSPFNYWSTTVNFSSVSMGVDIPDNIQFLGGPTLYISDFFKPAYNNIGYDFGGVSETLIDLTDDYFPNGLNSIAEDAQVHLPNGARAYGSMKDYTGPTSITPTPSRQTINTSGKYVGSNIYVEKIPEEYIDLSDVNAKQEDVLIAKQLGGSSSYTHLKAGVQNSTETDYYVDYGTMLYSNLNGSDIVSLPTSYVNGGSILQYNPKINNKNDIITIKSGYVAHDDNIQINSIEKSKIIPSNIKSGVTILGVEGNIESPTGTIEITSAGNTDVTNYATAHVNAGDTGTPVASKLSAHNHSIEVVPSVTNSTGYITGGTKVGTSVTVSASELVSGTAEITNTSTSSPTDITNYKYAYVPAGSAGTPTANRSTFPGHIIGIQPTVTNSAGYITGGTKTGDYIYISASDLVSGKKIITNTNENDVTNYATAQVSDANLIPSNIKSGVTILGVEGNISVPEVTVTLNNYSGYTVALTHMPHIPDL